MIQTTNKLKIAISQFPVSTQISKNKKYILKQMTMASNGGADIIHFPETALSGYEADMYNITWKELNEALNEVKQFANKLNLYVILGLHHKASQQKPYNCLYVISSNGQIIGKYIKNHLYKSESKRFQTGSNFLIQKIKGVKCGFLICYDSCFPKMFEYYREQGVELLFLSLYNAKSRNGKNSLDYLAKAQIATRAADNQMYISTSNSSARYSRLPASFAMPDGAVQSFSRHKTGILLCNYPVANLGWTYDNRRDYD